VKGLLVILSFLTCCMESIVMSNDKGPNKTSGTICLLQLLFSSLYVMLICNQGVQKFNLHLEVLFTESKYPNTSIFF